MTGSIPEPASRAYEQPSQPAVPASSSHAPASSRAPAFTNPRSAALVAMFGGHEPKRTPEEHAAIKAEAQRKRDEADAARRLKAATKRQKELAEEARKAAAKAERAKRK